MADNNLERRGVENTAQGKKDELVGKAQRGLGDLTGNKSQKTKGRMREAKGNTQQGVGRAERDAHDALTRDDEA